MRKPRAPSGGDEVPSQSNEFGMSSEDIYILLIIHLPLLTYKATSNVAVCGDEARA
ncbi:hypothetical protein ACP70R_028226 [Stipagrostis hirtigluma subsp. patula]